MQQNSEVTKSLLQLSETALLAQNKYAQEDEEGLREALTDAALLLSHIMRNHNVPDILTQHKESAPQTPIGEFAALWHETAEHIYQDNVRKGFWGDGTVERNVGEAIALMHSELSETLEAYRHGNPRSEKIPSFSHVEEEFADLIIRVMDFTAAHTMRIPEAIAAKIEHNRGRPPKHGKTF